MSALGGEEGRAQHIQPRLLLPPAVHRTDRLAEGLLQPDSREDGGRTLAIDLAQQGVYFIYTQG